MLKHYVCVFFLENIYSSKTTGGFPMEENVLSQKYQKAYLFLKQRNVYDLRAYGRACIPHFLLIFNLSSIFGAETFAN